MNQLRKSVCIPIFAFAVPLSGCAPGPGSFGPIGPAEFQSIFLAALVGIGAYIALKMKKERQRKNLSSSIKTPSEAEEILKNRYARGEITREEYLKILEDIQSGSKGK